MALGNEIMARGDELMRRNNELFVQNVELMNEVREELRLSHEQHADLREFIRAQNLRAERVADRQVRTLDQLIAKIDDSRDETRAQTRALLEVLDRLG